MRKSKLATPHWQDAPISPTCQVGGPEESQMCGQRTTHAYPAHRIGWMALCRAHARGHPEARPIAEVNERIR
jgi:hypothetical protein